MKIPLILALFAAYGLTGRAPETPMTKEAHAFLATLNAQQRAEALRAPDDALRLDWHFVPRSRKGVSWAMLSEPQRAAARNLLKSALSQAGYRRIEAIRELENVLKAMENNPGRDVLAYTFLFFGEPSDRGDWAWRYEGHHLSLSFGFRDGQMVSSTPQFLGSNPANSEKGGRPLAETQDLGFAFLNSLSPAQRAQAVIAPETTGDIVTGVQRQAAIRDAAGLSLADLSRTQELALMALLRAHADVQRPAEQKRRLDALAKAKRKDLKFAWLGATEPGKRHYYRIFGPNLVVEYDNSQNNGNHIHTVWRDPREDFAPDPLREHYEHGHAH